MVLAEVKSYAGELSIEVRVQKTLDRLGTGAVDVGEECDFIWIAARDGDHAYLYHLARELEFSDEMRQSPLGQIGAIWSLVSEIEEAVLSIPGTASAETLFRFAHLERRNSLSHTPGGVERRRYFASRLVLNQPRPALLEVMERCEDEAAYEELLFMLVQELVVQGQDPPAPTMTRLSERMRGRDHPLAWLPLGLTELESIRTDSRRVRTIHQFKVYRNRRDFPWGPPEKIPTDEERPRFSFKNWEITQGDDLIRIGAAVQSWQAESNGSWEARVFALDPPLLAENLGRMHFLRLHRCRALDLPRGPGDLHFERITPSQAFAVLFHAAANGGELNEGYLGTYGRLYAWHSLAGLAGAPPAAAVDEVLARAGETSWFFFAATSPWFHGLSEEFGLLALRGDGRSLAFLAATDKD